MKEVIWIEKYRKQLFAAQLAIAFIFGPAIAHSIRKGDMWWTAIMIGVIILVTEIFLALVRVSFAKTAHARKKAFHSKAQLAHTKLKKEYTELSGERINSYRPVQKKKRKPKGKKTHRNK